MMVAEDLLKMGAIFDANLEALQVRDPQLADELKVTALPNDRRVYLNHRNVYVFQARNQNGKWLSLTSAYKPENEADCQANVEGIDTAKVIFVVGEAGFYHVEAVLRQAKEDAIVAVLANSTSNIRLILENRDLVDTLNDKRLVLFVSDSVEDLRDYINALIYADAFTVPMFAYVVHPMEEQLNPGLCFELRQHLHRMYSTALVNFNTVRIFEHNWSENLLLNVPYAVSGIPVATMKDSLRGIPAIVVGAGPSLNKNIELLHEVRGKAFVICVDTAFRALTKRGIIPDLLVTMDGSSLNAEHLRSCNYSDIPLLMDVYSHHEISIHHDGPKIITSAVSQHVDWWRKTIGEDPASFNLSQGGSVATAGFSFARFVGADPIIMIGVDLSYPNGQAYVSGALHENRTIKDIKVNRELYPVKDIFGQEVFTTYDYLFYLRWFEHAAKNISDITLINATEGGALRQGFSIRTLRETLDGCCLNQVSLNLWRDRLHSSPVKDEKVQTVYRNLKRGRVELRAVHRILNILKVKMAEYLDLVEQREFDRGEVLLRSIGVATQTMTSHSLAMSFLDAHSFDTIVKDIRVTESFDRERSEHTDVENAAFAVRKSYTLYTELADTAKQSVEMYNKAIRQYERLFGLECEVVTQ